MRVHASDEERQRMRLKKLSEQVIVITGASSGIGRATAKLAAQRGAQVVLTARSTAELVKVVADIQQAGGRATYYTADVTRPEQVEAVAEYAEKEFGRIDTWVNNAGVSAYGRIEQLGLDDMRQVMDVTYWGVVNGSRSALPRLRRQGGALINVGSEVSTSPVPLQGPYVAAKHAVAGFTDVLRLELDADKANVSVTLIRPGSIDTPFFRHAKSVTGEAPAPPPPVYAPELVAQAILHCAEHAQRDVVVGGAARAMIGLSQNAPRLADKLFSRTLFKSQQSGPRSRSYEGSLYAAGGPASAHGGYNGRQRSLYTSLSLHPWAGALTVILLGAGLAAATRGLR
jgi:short-subunit dehydrogenase